MHKASKHTSFENLEYSINCKLCEKTEQNRPEVRKHMLYWYKRTFCLLFLFLHFYRKFNIKEHMQNGQNNDIIIILFFCVYRIRLPGAVPQPLFYFYMFQVSSFFLRFSSIDPKLSCFQFKKKNEVVIHIQKNWGRLSFSKNWEGFPHFIFFGCKNVAYDWGSQIAARSGEPCQTL